MAILPTLLGSSGFPIDQKIGSLPFLHQNHYIPLDMAEAAPHYGTLRFDIPDQSSTSEERGLFAPPGAKEVVYEKLPLHNFHTSPDVVKGGAGLDVQGFTWIQHRSVLQNSDQWLEGQNIEATYLAECEDLICRATGAKRAIANNAFFRRRPQDDMSDPKHVHLRDTPLDKAIGQLPRDANYGKS